MICPHCHRPMETNPCPLCGSKVRDGEIGEPGFGKLMYKGKEIEFSAPADGVPEIIEVSMITFGGSFDPDGKSSYDLCPGHKWRKHKKLPSDWRYCTKCRTQMLFHLCPNAKIVMAGGELDKDNNVNTKQVPTCSKCGIRCEVHK